MNGPLGALPRLSASARRALVGIAVLAALNAAALVGQAWGLATALAAIVAGNVEALAGPLGVFAGAVLARAVLAWATETVAVAAAAGAKQELRAALVDHALRLGPEWIADSQAPGGGPAALTSLATKGLDALDNYFTRYLPALVTAAVVPPLIGLWILLSDWPSAVLIAVTVPLVPIFAILVGGYTAQVSERAAETTLRLSSHLAELVRALPVLTAFRRAKAQTETIRQVSDAHRRAVGATLRVAFLSALVLELLATISVALVAVVIGVRMVEGGLDLSVGLLVLVLAPECYLPLRAAGAAHHASTDGMEAVRRVSSVLAEPLADQGTGVRTLADGPLVVEGLSVARRGGFAPDQLSFRVRPGELVRLDSPSGSGKSTALAVLLKFVTATEGSVRVGGVDLSTVDADSWRRHVAWVPQRPAFGTATVRAELHLAVADQPGGPPTAAELADVAGQAAAGALLDRRIDELSQGERQRIAVARALLRVRRGAGLLLLDEPTAHLDPAIASQVMAAVQRAADAGAAVVLAAHVTHEPAAEPTIGGREAVRASTAEARPHRAPLSIRSLLTPRAVGGALLGAAALAAGIALTAVSAWLIASASLQPPMLTLLVAVVAVRTFGIGRALLRYLERLVSHDAAFRVATALRVRLWRSLVALGPARSVGLRRDGWQRLVDDTDTVRDLVPRVLVPPVVAAVVAGVAIAVQAAILPAAGLVLAGLVVLAGVAAPAVALRTEHRASTALARGRRRLAAQLRWLLEAAPDMVASGAHRFLLAELAGIDTELAAKARRQSLGEGAASFVVIVATGIASLAGIVLGAQAVAAGVLEPLLVPVLALVPLGTVEALAALPGAARQWSPLRAAHARLHPANPDLSGRNVTSQPHYGRNVTLRFDGGIRLEHVDVRWPGMDTPALHDLSVQVPAGGELAVVGPSGSGKSTLLALLLGFLAPEGGRAGLPDRAVWCPQDAQLVSTTVRENLRLGDPEADDDQLRAALRTVAMAHWTDRLDVRVGVAGAALSGGEAQRLALARTLLYAKNAQVVLLDEPTAHLDQLTARRVLAGLRRELADHTLVIVTHRAGEIPRSAITLTLAETGRHRAPLSKAATH